MEMHQPTSLFLTSNKIQVQTYQEPQHKTWYIYFTWTYRHRKGLVAQALRPRVDKWDLRRLKSCELKAAYRMGEKKIFTH